MARSVQQLAERIVSGNWLETEVGLSQQEAQLLARTVLRLRKKVVQQAGVIDRLRTENTTRRGS